MALAARSAPGALASAAEEPQDDLMEVNNNAGLFDDLLTSFSSTLSREKRSLWTGHGDAACEMLLAIDEPLFSHLGR